MNETALQAWEMAAGVLRFSKPHYPNDIVSHRVDLGGVVYLWRITLFSPSRH